VLFEPLEASFGWDRASVSLAFAISLVFFGLGAPLGGWLIDRYGPRRQEVVRQCFQNVADSTHAGQISQRESGVGLCRDKFERSLCEDLGYSRPS
jgi:nitrate/nitrite transporter NarK